MPFTRSLFAAVAVAVFSSVGTQVILGGDCGCDASRSCSACVEYRGKHCRHHCRHSCECAPPSRATTRRLEPVPRATIVDSMPVFQMTPGVVAMPMMMAGFPMAGRGVNLDTRDLAPPRSAEQTCASSKGRLDELEMQVDALNDRMKTIQRSVELQTKILEEIRTEFPRKQRPIQAPADYPG